MRAVVQRVSCARVEIGGEVTGAVERGLLVFLGVGRGDDEKHGEYLAEKVAHLRIFEDAEERMNLSVLDVDGGVLVISQFTLYGDCRKGRRPSFIAAMEPGEADRLYRSFVEALRRFTPKVCEGVFQAHMHVSLVNDGPVTILLDSGRSF